MVIISGMVMMGRSLLTARGVEIVKGSRDKNFLVWNIQEDPDRDALLPVAVQRTCVDDCVWCGAAYDLGLLAVGSGHCWN